MEKGGVQKAIAMAKSIKVQYYELGILNFTLFVGIFIKQLPILYLIGSFIFIRIAFAFVMHSVLKVSKANDQNPTFIINDEIQKKIYEFKKQAGGYLKHAGDMISGQNSINTILYVLVALYFSMTFLPECCESILLINFLFIWMFMREQFFSWIEKAMSCCQKCKK